MQREKISFDITCIIYLASFGFGVNIKPCAETYIYMYVMLFLKHDFRMRASASSFKQRPVHFIYIYIYIYVSKCSLYTFIQ